MFYQLQTIWEFALVIFLLLVFSWLFTKNPQKGIYLTIFLLPVYLIKLKLGVLSLTLLDCIGLVLFFVFVFHYFKKQVKIPPFNKKYLLVILFFLVFVLIASFLADDSLRALGLFKSIILFPFLMSVIFYSYCFKDKKCFKEVFLRPLFFSALAVSLIALAFKIFGSVTFDGRLSAFWQSPNQLAMYLTVGWLAAVALFFNAKTRPKKITLILGSISILFAIFWSFSLGAWLAFILAPVLGLLFYKAKNKKLIFITFIAIYLITLFFLLVFGDQLAFVFGRSFYSRTIIWQVAQNLSIENCFFGIGLGNFQNQYLALQGQYPLYPEWAVPHPHNLWLSAWLSLGLLGFVSFVWLFFKSFWRALNKELLFFILFALYVLILGLVDEPIFRNDLAVVFWLFLSQSLFLSNLKSSR